MPPLKMARQHLSNGFGISYLYFSNSKLFIMKLDVYVNYKGNCREAFRFYEQHLGGTLISMETFRQMPPEANIPEERKDDILHARIAIGGMVLMGADIPGADHAKRLPDTPVRQPGRSGKDLRRVD